MKFLVVALALVSICFAQQSDDEWLSYQLRYGKLYRSAEESNNRRAIWEDNWKKIKQHNEEFAKGLTTYTKGENQFTDMTFEEFSKERLGFNPKFSREIAKMEPHEMTSRAVGAYDLRQFGHISAIKDQGKCGSCWAFAAVGAVEAFIARTKGVAPPDLSEQQLVDCSKGTTTVLFILTQNANQGCKGGSIGPTFNDISKTGLMNQASYKYTGVDGSCKYDSTKVVAKINGYKSITTETALTDAIAANNAVDVAMAVTDGFQSYKSGVYVSTATEDKAQLNHAVLAVGFDTKSEGGYLIIKNSWANTWGENGYFRIRYGKTALGIGSQGSYPI